MEHREHLCPHLSHRCECAGVCPDGSGDGVDRQFPPPPPQLAEVSPAVESKATKVAPKNTRAPAISGTTRVPNQLSVTNGTWSGSPTSYTYQWFRCTSAVKKAAATLAASCSTINSATAATYTLTDADAGKFMVARVSGVNATGTVSIHSASTSAVVAQFLPPGNTVAPVVTGSTVTTSTLSTSNGTWTESPTTYTYQWFRCAKIQKAPGNALASGCSNIGGATGSTYDLVAADVGKFVGVAVTARNVAGSSVKWSKTTAAVTAFPTPANTVAPVVSGTAQVSRILTLSNGTWNNRPTGYAYKWYACTASKAAGATLPSGCTQIAGETDATYQLLPGQQSRFVLGLVTATNVSGSTARYSATTTAVSVPSPYAPSAIVQPLVDIDGNSGDAISGRAMVGSVLIADEGTWLGYPIPEKRFSYWYRCAAAVTQSSSTQPAGCYVIEGSEGDINHVVTLDDLGDYLMYEVIATNTQGVVRNYTPTTSAVTATPIPYVQPALSGDPSYDSVLEISDGAWATPPSVDVDLFYSWHRCATATPVVLAGVPVDCEEIDGAQDSSYTVTEDDLGIYVFGVVTAVNSFDESASAVATTMGISDATPELLSTPTVSGTRVAGNALSVSEANYVAYPDPTVTVQWLRCTAAVSTATATLPGTCSTITGETGQSYTLVDADLGRFITARTTIVNTVGTLTTIAASTVAVGSVPIFTVAPAVTGTTIVGSTLTVSAGTATGTPTPTRTYQWFRCTDAIETVASSVPETCTAISGATAATYVTTVADTGKRLAVRVIAANAISTATSVTLTTTEVDVAPNRLTAPALTGARTQGEELSVSDGTWTAHPTPTITYQWVRCTVAVPVNTFAAPNTCVNISGATLSTHTATADDLGKFVTAIVTATNTRGSASTLAPSATSIASLPATVATPVVTGTATRGSVLSTTQIAWTGTPTPSLSLQWYRCVSPVDTVATVVPDGCAAISGATAATYTIVEADAGKYLTAASAATNVAGTARKIALSSTIVQSLPSIVVAPTITGDRWLGSELTVADGQWFEYPEATVTYQWYRCSSPVVAAATVPAHCSESITGATTNTYTLDGADAGKYLTAVVEHTNSLGTTRHIAAQPIATFLPPSIDTEPTLTGTAALGSTLTLSEGLWSGYPAPTVSSRLYSCSTEKKTTDNQVPADCFDIASPSNPTVSTGSSFSCAIMGDGLIRCWGGNGNGQLGDGTTNDRHTPVAVSGISSAVSVSAGDQHSCAVLADGSVRCWGYNGWGQLGDGTTTNRLTPVAVSGVSSAVSVSAGGNHSCAVLAGGSVRCWGFNANGNLGDGTTTDRLIPVVVSGVSFAVSVAAGNSHSCALNGRSIVCWGANSAGQLGDGTASQRVSPVYAFGIFDAVSVSVDGGGHSCAVLADGSARCWGPNEWGQLGDGTTTQRRTPVAVSGIASAVSVSAGINHSCAVLAGGVVKCWGYNLSGTLGDGTFTNRRTPVETVLPAWTKAFRIGQTEVGRFLAIRVVASNSGSSTTYFSATTNAVTAPPTPTTDPSTSGTRLVGQTLTLSPGVFVEYPASDSIAYKWYRCSVAIVATTTSSDSCYLISGANNLTYTQTVDDAGYYISGAVTRTNSIATVTTWSAASSTTNQAPVSVIDGFIDGDPIAGTSLNASEGMWQGFPVPSLQFQWYRCSTAVASVVATVPAGCATIAAATTSNYLLAPADMGHYITFAVTRANTLGSVTRVAQSTAVVTGVPVVVTAPAVTGTRVSESVLTISAGSWLGHPSATTTRQWYRCTSTVAVTESTPSGCTAIEGESGLTYTQTLTDAGKYVTATTTQTNANGAKTVWAAASLTSNYPPTLVTEPSISGTASFNSTLSAATGEWLGFPTPTPTYQWYRCAAEVASETSTVPAGCDVIATSGSSATYTAVGPDMGKFLVVRVTQTNSVTSSVRFTRSTAVVTGSPVAQIVPEIAGIRTLGQTLSVTGGTWWAHPAISDTAYQWYRCSAAVSSAIATVPGTCAEIEGEDANSYVLTTDDSGAFITAKVSRTNSVGTSAMVAAQTTASTQIPTNTAAPSISGTINMGELLTASEGTWQGFPRPTYTYEWLECSSEVATASSTRPAGCAEFQSDAKISAGSTHTCVAQADGTAYCWGASSGSFSTSTPTAQSGSDKVVQVASGNGFTCYVLVDSSVKCFGANGSGQVGDGTTSTRSTAVAASGLRGVRSVDVGDAFACALMIDGTVRCWGNNASGQLGLGNTTNQSTPQTVPGLVNVISMDTGASHACAVISGGTVRCWGLGGSGQVGNGATTNQSSPTAVSAITTAASVSAGGSHSCAVLTTGGVRCWGLNTSGQLGNASLTSTSAPVGPLNLTTGASSVAAGTSHTCVTMSDGTAKCWGANASGQLGTGNTTNASVPSTVSGLSGVSNISAGGSHTCVSQRSGSVACWGLNTSGQIGDGTTTSPRLTATSRTFNLSKVLINEAEFGKHLVSAVSASNSVGAATRYTTSSALVASRPFLLVPPALSAGVGFGSTLTVSSGSWTSSSPVSGYEYQWYRCAGTVAESQRTIPADCEAIAGATTNSYVLTANEAGKHIGASVTAMANSGPDFAITATNGPVTVPPTMAAPPQVTGSAAYGATATIEIDVGEWGGYPTPTISARWLVCDSPNANVTNSIPPGCAPNPSEGKALALGHAHSCVLLASAEIACWGSNLNGRLGDGTTTERLSKVKVNGISTATSLSSGQNHSCAVLANGGVKCWGSNSGGQLGDPTATSPSPPVSVSGISNAKLVVASPGAHSCALLVDGTVKCWGANTYGALGDGTTVNRNSPVTVSGLSNVTSIAVSGFGGCALLSNGSVKCWGPNWYGEVGDGTTTTRLTPTIVAGITNAIAITSGTNHSCAILSDQTAKCWGQGTDGVLGDGTTNNRSTPVTVSGLSGVVAISSGSQHSCALLGNQTIKCWGNGLYGHLGDGSSSNRLTPTLVSGITTASSLVVGGHHTCAGLTDGNFKCWGSNQFGQVGDLTRIDRESPVLLLQEIQSGAGLNTLVTSLGKYFVAEVTASNSFGSKTVWTASSDAVSAAPFYTTAPEVSGIRVKGNVLSVDEGVWLAYPARDTSRQWYRCSSAVSAPVTSLPAQCSTIDGATASTYEQVSADAGRYVTVATKQTNTIGELTLWSTTTEISIQPPTMVLGPRVLGDTPSSSVLTADVGVWEGYPSPTVSYQWYRCSGEIPESSSSLPGGCAAVANVPIAVSAGQSHSCSLMSDGTVYCWGLSSSGQLGSGIGPYSSSTPVKIVGVAGATSISAGTDHTCALAGGVPHCWGYNQFRQLGDGTQINRSAPVVLSSLSGVTAIAAGGMHTCALLATGGVRCWGYNQVGALGGAGDGRTPVAASGIVDATAITTGSSHSCALLSNGTVKCWGYNGYGQLGDGNGTGVNRLVPTLVSGLTGVVAIDAGGNHTCALLGDGQARCWGNNEAGQLGTGATSSFGTPSAVADLNNAVSISTGGDHSCALMAGGEVKCWGFNGYGQLGDGSSTARSRAVVITELTSATEISAGFYHSCALLSSGTVKCTGENSYGQLGDGTSNRRNIPTPVVGYSFGNLNSAGFVGEYLMVGTTARNRFGTAKVWSPTAGPIPAP